MTRRSNIAYTLCFGLALAAVTTPATPVAARKARSEKKKPAKQALPKVNSAAVGELMGAFKWGMSHTKVLSVLNKRIDEKYKEQITSTTDVYEQDRLRAAAKKEKQKLAKTYTEFPAGKKTGWEVSIIDDEFARGNGESMLVYWEHEPEKKLNQRRFFFFVDDRLYKMYIAFDASMFPEGKRTFDYFRSIMEGRYGPGALVAENDGTGSAVIKHLEWGDKVFYVRAVNRVNFYGTFCLALSSTKVEAWLGDRRAKRSPKNQKGNSIIEAMVEDGNADDSLLNSNESAVDHMLRK
jgi:hypothetical protein